MLRDLDNRQLLNTRAPLGTQLPTSGDPPPDPELVARGEPWVSNLFVGAVAQAPLYSVNLPVLLADGRKLVLDMSRPVELAHRHPPAHRPAAALGSRNFRSQQPDSCALHAASALRWASAGLRDPQADKRPGRGLVHNQPGGSTRPARLRDIAHLRLDGRHLGAHGRGRAALRAFPEAVAARRCRVAGTFRRSCDRVRAADGPPDTRHLGSGCQPGAKRDGAATYHLPATGGQRGERCLARRGQAAGGAARSLVAQRGARARSPRTHHARPRRHRPRHVGQGYSPPTGSSGRKACTTSSGDSTTRFPAHPTRC